HAQPMVNFWNRSMSITPTAGSAAPIRSGRWGITAPTSRPPFEPPWMARREGRVHFSPPSHPPPPLKPSHTLLLFPFFLFPLPPPRATLRAAPPPPPEIRARQDPATLHPREPGRLERRRLRDVEAAVAVEQHGTLAVGRGSLPEGERHRHAGAVLARVED